jgi:tRNA nucleotidyltransferase (CCA-adding enzyme)
MDFALPRRENPTGTGHRDFEIALDSSMNEKDAASRRDFTMNALMQNILTGEILDFFGGKEDIEKGIIRHVSDEHFCEDPLRVFRGAQFAARFDFDTDPKTLEMYKKTPLDSLSHQRVMEEMKKALLLSQKP